MAYITADQERSYARKAATEALTQVAHRIEGEISRELQVAETLAELGRARSGEFAGFLSRGNADRGRPPAVGNRRADEAGPGAGPECAPAARRSAWTGNRHRKLQRRARTRKPVLGGLGPYQAAIGKQLVSLRFPLSGMVNSVMS